MKLGPLSEGSATPGGGPGRVRLSGIGLRSGHYRSLLAQTPDVAWLEVHSENYFGDGGQPLYFLERARALYPASLHGVGLSLGSCDPLDREHLERLRTRRSLPYLPDVARLEWAVHEAFHAADVQPFPFAKLARLDPRDYGQLRLLLHPACRLMRSQFPVVFILRRSFSGPGSPRFRAGAPHSRCSNTSTMSPCCRQMSRRCSEPAPN